jgi:hypothetical protein
VRPEHRGCQRPRVPARDIRCPAKPDTWPGPIGPALRADGPARIPRPRYRRVLHPFRHDDYHVIIANSATLMQHLFTIPLATQPLCGLSGREPDIALTRAIGPGPAHGYDAFGGG